MTKNPFRDAWGHTHAVLPVIHVESLDQARRNANIAFEAGADGIFVINHGMSGWALLEIAETLRAEFPRQWLGINCLGFPNARTIGQALTLNLDGVWADNGHIDETKEEQPSAEGIRQAFHDIPGRAQLLYFGGVAFKTQRHVEDVERAAKLATGYMDVVTTSGPGTAKAAAVEKIARMRKGAGNALLGIASGITPENVRSYMPYANCFLVASGISTSWSELDPARTRALVQAVKDNG